MPTLVYSNTQRAQFKSPDSYVPNSRTYISCSKLIDAIMDYKRSKRVIVEKDRFTYSMKDKKIVIRLKRGLR